MVERRPDQDDRRKQLVVLTAAGQEVVDEFLPEIVALQAAIMAELSERDRDRLLAALTAIRETIADLDIDSVVAAAPARVKPSRG